MITVYRLPSSQSSRKAEAFFGDLEVPFIIRNMNTSPISFEELKHILSYTENGVDDILAKGKIREKLLEEGVDFDEITLKELHYYIKRYPKLMKAPIVNGNGRQVIGFDDDKYKVFIPRHIRQESLAEKLEAMRAIEDEKLANKEPIATGHWG
jgi:regulatory protein spx